MNALTRWIAWAMTVLFKSILKPLFRQSVTWWTGKSELERLLDQDGSGCRADLILQLEQLLTESSQDSVKAILFASDIGCTKDYASRILKTYSISPLKSEHLRKTLESWLPYLISYNDLINTVEKLRQTPYDSQDKAHERELLKLWSDLQPDMPLKARISSDWSEIGFQGEDPKTDFRGMGLLGLRNLSFFAAGDKFGSAARRCVVRSHHPQYWYSWAIVGINLTSLCYEFLKKGHLKRSFYESASHDEKDSLCCLEQYHSIFCLTFIAFDEFWIRQQKSIMEFNSVREEFRLILLRRLRAGHFMDKALKYFHEI